MLFRSLQCAVHCVAHFSVLCVVWPTLLCCALFNPLQCAVHCVAHFSVLCTVWRTSVCCALCGPLQCAVRCVIHFSALCIVWPIQCAVHCVAHFSPSQPGQRCHIRTLFSLRTLSCFGSCADLGGFQGLPGRPE